MKFNFFDGEKTKKKELFSRLLKYKKWILLAIFFTTLSSLIQIPFPFISKIVIDDVVLKGNTDRVLLILILIIILIPLNVVVPSLCRYYIIKLIRKTSFALRQSLCSKYLRLEISQYQDKGSGYFASRIFEDIDRLVGNFYQSSFPIFYNISLFFIGFLFSMKISIKLTLVLFLISPFYGYLNIKFGKQLKKEFSLLVEKRSMLLSSFNDLLQTIISTRILGIERIQKTIFFKADKDQIHQQKNEFKNRLLLEGLNTSISILVPSLTLLFGIDLMIKRKLTLGEFVAFSSFATYMLSSIRYFFNSNTSLQDLRVSFNRLVEAFSWPMSHEFSTDNKIRISSIDQISFDSVNFSYNGNQILKNINFKIAKGERVVLMGESGSGKTTILKLMLGLYLPLNGDIRFSGISNRKISLISLREHIAFVEQEPILYEGSISDNISLNLFKLNSDDIQNRVTIAAKMANAHDFIMGIPNNYAADCKRLGTNFSIGQKQRIALSRSFYKKADLIILDEPTSAIDNDSINLIKETIGNIPRDVTIIIATHSQSLANCGDRVLHIEKGIIVDGNSINQFNDRLV